MTLNLEEAEDIEPKVVVYGISSESGDLVPLEPPIIAGSVGDNQTFGNGVMISTGLNLGYDAGGSNWDRVGIDNAQADAIATEATNRFLKCAALGYLHNGTSIDRQRNNQEETLLASAARTANTNSADFTNYNARGAHFIIDVTAITATPQITVTVQGQDPVSGNYYDILIGPVISTVSTNVLKVYPGIVAQPNASASDILPRTYRVSVAHADADSITYSIAANVVL